MFHIAEVDIIQKSQDGTIKVGFALHDGRTVEGELSFQQVNGLRPAFPLKLVAPFIVLFVPQDNLSAIVI